MNCVRYPPPSAICGKTIGDGDGRVASATGNVVSRKSPRVFVRDRSVSATKGASEEISSRPVKFAGRSEITCETNLAKCPF
jgi:hypothetical protein